MSTDKIADLLTRLRNANMRGHTSVKAPDSKLRCCILSVLEQEGYINGYEKGLDSRGHSELTISLKPKLFRALKRVSKPGCRVYVPSKKIPIVAGGLGIAIVSTSKGVLADHRARQENLGGEVLCTVF
jgi:small subunit ribosomal protein S8